MLSSLTQVLLHSKNVPLKALSQPLIFSHERFSIDSKSLIDDHSNNSVSNSNEPDGSIKNSPGQLVIHCPAFPELQHFQNTNYPRKLPSICRWWDWRKVQRETEDQHFSILPQQKTFWPELERNVTRFNDTGLDCTLVDILNKHKFTTPTEIQREAIPSVLSGKTCMIAAESGSGKTFAYLVPLIQRVIECKKNFKGVQDVNSPFGIILCSTRQLASQIHDVLQMFTSELDFDAGLVIGGSGMMDDVDSKFVKSDLVVASFGMLEKMVSQGKYSLRNVKYVVLDDAGALFEMVKEDLNDLLNLMKVHNEQSRNGESLQFVLTCSAIPMYFNENVKRVLNIEDIESISSPNLHMLQPHVKHSFYPLSRDGKMKYLWRLVHESVEKKEPMLIFSNSSEIAKWIHYSLDRKISNCVTINHQTIAPLRSSNYKAFQNGEVYICSSLVTYFRTVDTTNVKRVLNYDLPFDAFDYTHRSGRVGRIGSPKNCEVINFVRRFDPELDMVERIEMAARMNAPLFDDAKNPLCRQSNRNQPRDTTYDFQSYRN